MIKQKILLDLDDTLIHCNKYFKETLEIYTLKMKQWFPINENEIREKQLEFDLKNVSEYGLHSKHFPKSFVSTYKYYSKKFNLEIQEQHIDEVHKIAASVFNINVEPFPETYEVLSTLKKQGHDLYLYTGGDHCNQNRKIWQLGLQSYFSDGIFIFEHKNVTSLQKTLNEINFNNNFIWMIGNSLRTDIQPAIELGINAIHIPSELEWSYNNIKLEGTYNTLQSLKEVPDYIQRFSQHNLIT